MRASLDMRADRVAARVRSNNQLATKSGFARTNGGYICRNRCRYDVVRGIDTGESRHVDVEEADVGMPLLEQPHRLPPVPRLGHNLDLGPHDPKLAPQRIAQQRFIVGDQRCRVGVHVCAGISTSTATPRSDPCLSWVATPYSGDCAPLLRELVPRENRYDEPATSAIVGRHGSQPAR